jgi:hypothetical protein
MSDSDYWKKQYDKPGRREKVYAAVKNRKAMIKAWLISLKEGKPCTKCGGIFHHMAMEWHHRDPSTKVFNIADAVSLGYSKEPILAENAKCDLKCANCHRISGI